MHVAILINHPCIAGIDPLSVESFQVSFIEPFFIVEQGRQTRRCERDAKNDVAHPALPHLRALIVYYSDIKTRHRFSRRARFDRQWRVLLGTRVLLTGSGNHRNA